MNDKIIKMMTDDPFENSLVAKLSAEGYVAIHSYKPSALPGGLAMLGISCAHGLYSKVCVLPVDRALEGSRCKPVNDEILVYARINTEHPHYDQKSVHIVMLECLVDGEEIKFLHL